MTIIRPTIIGIVGDSGAGKSTFASGLAEVLGTKRTAVISMDDYLRFSRRRRAELDLTPIDPSANYMDILEQHVDLLRRGQPILKPVYNHQGGELEPAEYVEPKRFIILEGLLGFLTPRLREAYDVKFYMEPQEQLRLRWKFRRDTGWGGYTVEQVMAALPRLKHDSALYILPQRAYADMIINFYPPETAIEESGPNLNVRHILRPTLPYLDLAPLLEVGAGNGILLELARDVDGRPVDALHISGTASEAIEDYLWSLVPEPPETSGLLGFYPEAVDRRAFSRPLALSQLLVAHYLLSAAVDHHAL